MLYGCNGSHSVSLAFYEPIKTLTLEVYEEQKRIRPYPRCRAMADCTLFPKDMYLASSNIPGMRL